MNLNNEFENFSKVERPGREIKIEGNNPNITSKIGTIDDKNSPKTVYVSISFWVDTKNKQDEEEAYGSRISKQFAKELANIYRIELKDTLNKSDFFPFFNDNIYVYDFPHNLNYNQKRSFVSIELNLHTCNCLSNSEKYPLKTKDNTILFDELVKIHDIMSDSKLLQGETEFSIHKSKD